MSWGQDLPPNQINEREWVLQDPKSRLYIYVALNEEHSEISRRAMAGIVEAMNELWEIRRKEKNQ